MPIASSQPISSDSVVALFPRIAKNPKTIVNRLMKMPNCQA